MNSINLHTSSFYCSEFPQKVNYEPGLIASLRNIQPGVQSRLANWVLCNLPWITSVYAGLSHSTTLDRHLKARSEVLRKARTRPPGKNQVATIKNTCGLSVHEGRAFIPRHMPEKKPLGPNSVFATPIPLVRTTHTYPISAVEGRKKKHRGITPCH